MAETFRSSLRPTIGREKNMKTSKNLIAGLALFSGLLAFATSASADWGHPRNDLHRDRQELSAARRELHNDIRRGAGRAEIAGDRAAIARERRDLWQDRREWRNDRWHNYDNGRRYGWWNRR
jgi:outer membrane murein-binding lipoprotein Lpp